MTPMSDYSTDIQKDFYFPMNLVQIDITNELTFSTSRYAYVFVTSFLNEYDWIDSTLLGSGSVVADVVGIGSVRADVYLRSVSNITEVQDNRETFYYNTGDKKLYLHCPRGAHPYLFDIQIGVIFGYRKGGTTDDSYFNDIYHDDRVKSIPSIKRERADYYNARNIAQGGNITMKNVDGDLDTWAEDQGVIGNAVRVYAGMSTYTFDQYKLVSVNYIEDVTVGPEEVNIKITDKKKRLDVPLPENTYETSDYTYLADNDIGKVIPYAYGDLRNIPVTCTNQTEFDYDADNRPAPAETLDFKLCDMTYYDAINAIDAVYVEDGDGHKTDVTLQIVADLTNGEFTLSSDYYVPGQTVTADIKGYEDPDGNLIENGLDIIKELIVNHTTAKYNTVYFNISRWNRLRAFDAAIFIDTDTDLRKTIEQITQEGQLATFGIDDDDRYSCVIFDKLGGVNLDLQEWAVDGTVAVSWGQPQLVSELVVEYDRDWATGETKKYRNTDYQADNSYKYQTNKRKTILTLLKNETDAQAFALRFLEVYGVPYRKCDITMGLIGIEQELSNILRLELKRPFSIDLGVAKNEIIATNKDFNNHKVTHTCRIFDLTLPQVFSAGHDWLSFDWLGEDWAIDEYVDDIA